MQTCVTSVWPERHSNLSALTVALPTSQLSYIFKACYLQAVTSHCLSKSCLLTNDDSLQDLLVRFSDKPAFLKCTPCVPCRSCPLLGPVMHGAPALCAGT